jgi:DNA polymerase-1|tara:strand:- start:536 stop:1519 length:984 start_codon:yes stop_codon:yes gene_type:complete
MPNKKIMIIDALNMFLRSYVVNPSLGPNGDPIGGFYGFLKSMQKCIREIDPQEVHICWDGPGGAVRKRSENKGYKEGRKPIKMNWNYNHLTDDDKLKNKVWQQLRLIEYLETLPVKQYLHEGIEADDIIAYLCTFPGSKDAVKIIVSSDKDFLQLCSNDTILYRPISDSFETHKTVTEKYKVHPTNMALARAVEGDKSDNLPGVKGVGIKTLVKAFPFLSEDKFYGVDDILKGCRKVEKKMSVHKKLLESKDLLYSNYKMMQLYAPDIPIGVADGTKEVYNEPFSYSQKDFDAKLIKEGLGAYDWSSLRLFSRMVMNNQRTLAKQGA